MPKESQNLDYYFILALDGASITGGMGWISMGALRDRLQRNLELTEKGKTRFKDVLNDAPMLNHSLAGSMPFINPIEERINQLNPTKAMYFDTLAEVMNQDGYQDFLNYLGTLDNATASASKQSKRPPINKPVWLALWQQFRVNCPNEFPCSPLATELGVMKSALDLHQAPPDQQSVMLKHIHAIANAQGSEYRRNALRKNHPNELDYSQQEFGSKDPQEIVFLLLTFPYQFLKIRWISGVPIPQFIRDNIVLASRFLYQTQKDKDLSNPSLADLDDIDLIAGTSSGGLNALMLAQHDSLNEGISAALKMWVEILSDVHQDNPLQKCSPRFVNAALGQESFMGDRMRRLFENYFGGNRTMADLKHSVAITSMQLDSGQADTVPILRRWKPVVYHYDNTPETGRSNISDSRFAGIRHFRIRPDAYSYANEISAAKIKLIDVACHTSTIPIASSVSKGLNLFPPPGSIETERRGAASNGGTPFKFEFNKTSGFLDGGFFANNPSLVAATVALSQDWTLDQLAIYSIGNGRQAQDFADVETDDLGYQSWLLTPRKGLAFDIILDGGVDAINGYCSTLLGPADRDTNPPSDGRYLREDVWLDKLFMLESTDRPGPAMMETILDEALGLQRYIYHLGLYESPDPFFTNYWSVPPIKQKAPKVKRQPKKSPKKRAPKKRKQRQKD